MTAVARWLVTLSVALLASGCISVPALDEDRAAACIRMTFHYAEITRGVERRIAIMTERTAEGFEIGVLENDPEHLHRIGTFLVRNNRRIDVWDFEKDEWRVVGYCD